LLTWHVEPTFIKRKKLSDCSPLLSSLQEADLDVNVMNFLPVLMDEYFHYHGSLTTGPHCTALHCTALHCTVLHCTALHCNLDIGTCDEAVNWMVFKVNYIKLIELLPDLGSGQYKALSQVCLSVCHN
jgi:hypothetical protein